MRRSCMLIGVALLMLSACSKQGEEDSAVNKPAMPAAAAGAPVVEQAAVPARQSAPVKTVQVQAATALPAAVKMAKSQPENAKPKAAGGALSRDEGLALAKKSGCLACHKIETKLIGPAWSDVSKRYKGDPAAKMRLVEKVKKGGKGNWTAVTGGMAMPPNSPRVPDADIEKLVMFVLAQ